ncbi:MAG: beta strand repeat-containing protein, partial [Oligosphaeraceae bacterium]
MNLITETRRQKKATRALSAFLAGVLLLSPGGLIAGQLPNGYKVAHGKVNVSVSGDVMNIEQLTNKAIVNWKDFSIGESNVVNVIQKQNLAKAIMLARVVGSNPSSILGQLNVDQSFFLVNPNGVYFGKNARVDVGAMFAASTLNITDADFLKGDFVFKGDTQKPVVNEGVINAASAALIGRNVANTGIVNAKQAALVATANSVELANFGHDAKLTLTFGNDTAAQNDAGIPVALNTGTVNATDGDVILYADGGLADNSQGTLIAKDAEISGAFVDLTHLGTVTADTLLIDPKGSLTIGTDTDSAPQWTYTDAMGPHNGQSWLDMTSPWVQTPATGADYTITAASLQRLLDGNTGIDSNVLTLNYDQFTILDDTTITSTRDRGLKLQTNPAPENTNRLITIGNNVTFDTHGSLTLDADTIVAGAKGASISSIYGAGVVNLSANTVGSADKAISLNFDTLNLNADTAYIKGDLNTINAEAKTDATAGTLAFDVLNPLNLTLSGDLTQKTLDVSVANGDLNLASALTAATIDLAATNIYLQNTITATDLKLKAFDTIIAANPLNVGSDTTQGTVNITANDNLSLVFDTLVLDSAKESAITSTNGNLTVTLTDAADQTLSASLAAGRDLDLTATNGSLTATGDLFAGRDLTIRVTGDGKDFTFVQSADKNISAGVNEKGTAVIGPGSITIEATGNVDIQGWVNGLGDPRPLAALDATKDILITAGKGDAFDEYHDLTVNANVSANKTITMRASGDLTVGDITTVDGSGEATAYITTLDNGEGATLIDLAARSGDLTIDAVLGYDTNYNLFPTDAVILSAGNDLTLNTDLRVGYSADLNANHTLAIGANGPVDVYAEFGDLTLNAGTSMEMSDSTLTAAKKLTLSTTGDITLTATTISADQVIVDAAEGLSFSMDADSAIEANTAITMAADTLELHGALTTFGDAIGNQGDITLNALSTITSDAAITANGDLAIATLAADLAGTLEATGDIAIATADALTVDANATITAGDNLTITADSLANDTLAGILTATAGDISVEVNNNLKLDGTIEAAGDVTLKVNSYENADGSTVTTNISDTANASITAGDTLTLDASGDITLTQGTIAAETYSVTAGNDLTATTLVNDLVDSTFSAGNDLTLATTGKLVNTDVLALGAVDITAVSILSSDLTGGSIKLTGDADNNDSLLADTSLTTTTGNLEVANFTSLQNVDATAAGNATLQATTIDGATVVATGTISAQATDAISASTLTAGGDVLF